MPALLILAFVKKYWKYILLFFVILSVFTYVSITLKHAHEYKVEKKQIIQQNKTITNLSTTLQKQKDYTVDLEKNNNTMNQSNMNITTESKKQVKTFQKNIDTAPENVNKDFNDMFERFNNE